MTPASAFPPLPGLAGRPFPWTSAGLRRHPLLKDNPRKASARLAQTGVRTFESFRQGGTVHSPRPPMTVLRRIGLAATAIAIPAVIAFAPAWDAKPASAQPTADAGSPPFAGVPRFTTGRAAPRTLGLAAAERRGLQSRAGTGRAGIRRRLSRSSAPAGGGADQQPERTRRRRSRQAEDRRARAAHLQRLSHLAADRSAARPDAAHRPAQRAGPERSDLLLAGAVSATTADRRLLQHDQPAHARAPRLAQRRQRQRAARDAAARGPVSRRRSRCPGIIPPAPSGTTPTCTGRRRSG